MEKIKKFIRQKSSMRKLTIFTGLLAAFWVNFIVFEAITGNPLTFTKAQKAIGVSMAVQPVNPVEKTEKAESRKSEKTTADFNSSEFRIISMISDAGEDNNETIPSQAIVRKPTVTFKGIAVYPNSEVFLTISSDKIFTSVMSDNRGDWFWTSRGYRLENGPHSIEVSNISPFDLSGKRDIFTQKYIFAVEADENDTGIEELPLENIPIEKQGGIELKNRLMDKNARGIYLFNITLLNKIEYNPNDEIYLEMIFNPLGNTSENEARIKYEIYSYNEENHKETLVYDFEDTANMSEGNAFLKKIKLKEIVQEGNYFIKVMAEIGDDKYVQSARFVIRPKTVVQIGSAKIDEENFNVATTWNVIFILGFAVAILILIIFEFKKMSLCNLVDEHELKKGNYFSN